MTREAYHQALNVVQEELRQMAEMAGDAIRSSMEALKTRDIEASKKVVHNDIFINRKRFEIEEKCIRLIATQQPMAVDLRTLAAIINIITDIERIGDHAEGLAKISLSIGDAPLVKPLIDLPKMADKALSM
ncbi:MAG: phosphate transport system regulatory protein PhoU, partial [Deltaproteobacteria bacterium]|nr:phosphate transport system regulatory protein PhoU [Deltaproteobacteria bacterium]